jgi:hypothetical protein
VLIYWYVGFLTSPKLDGMSNTTPEFIFSTFDRGIKGSRKRNIEYQMANLEYRSENAKNG